jgi:ribonuclease VapC
MIAVDTSALMAVVLNEKDAGHCATVLARETRTLISAGTLAEALIVAARRNIASEMEALIDGLAIEIASVTPAFARKVAAAYGRWGKGVDPAGLNFGDCFAYALARDNECPLLFVGDDFSRTDVRRAV